MAAGNKPKTGLFKELRRENTTDAPSPYSLEDFQEEFLEQGDTTGYLASQVLMTEVPSTERWNEWRRIFSSTPMKNYLEEWKEQLLLKIYAEAFRDVAKRRVDPKDWPKIRWILEGNLEKDRAKKPGRPSKGAPEKREMIIRRASAMSGPELDNIISLHKGVN